MKIEQKCFEYLAKISTPQLSENDKAFCEGKLTSQNIWEALNSMKNGKTPGDDGLTKEFYVCFFEELGSLLLKSLNHSHTFGELSTSQKQAVITLIEKKGRDKKLAKNWRPISLMNVDVKLSMGGGGSRGLWGGSIIFAWTLGFGVGCLGGRLVHWGW